MNETIREIRPVFQSQKETRNFYNKISHYYDLLAYWSEQQLRREGHKKLNVRAGERVLEIGFGTGHILIEIAHRVGPSGRIYGVDLSEEMIRIARQNARRQEIIEHLNVVCGDATKLPLSSEIFDAIYISFTLELFDTLQIAVVLSECMRVLRKSGRILIVGMSYENENGVVLNAIEWTHRHFPKFLDCRPIFVRRATEEAGFQIQNVARRTMWVPVEIVLAYKPVE